MAPIIHDRQVRKTSRPTYLLTVILFRTTLAPAFEEVTRKVATSLPGLLNLAFTRTALLLPAAILPTGRLSLMPLPVTLSLTPVAVADPVFLTLTL